MFLSLSCVACGLCRPNTVVWFLSSCCDVFWGVGDSNDKVGSIKTSSQIMVFSML